MKTEPLYIRQARSSAINMTNEELFDEMINAIESDANDMSDHRDTAYRRLYESMVRERLSDWLKISSNSNLK